VGSLQFNHRHSQLILVRHSLEIAKSGGRAFSQPNLLHCLKKKHSLFHGDESGADPYIAGVESIEKIKDRTELSVAGVFPVMNVSVLERMAAGTSTKFKSGWRIGANAEFGHTLKDLGVG
jgi:hypothetical protein